MPTTTITSDMSIQWAEFPEYLRTPGDKQASLMRAVRQETLPIARSIVAQAAAQTARYSQRVAHGYKVRDLTTSNRMVVEFSNEADTWQWLEDDTRPHFPPWKAPSLIQWAAAHGIPAFLVARKISRYGTKGRHIWRTLWDARSRELLAGMDRGVVQFLGRLGV
jgi:hypothetical protein